MPLLKRGKKTGLLDPRQSRGLVRPTTMFDALEGRPYHQPTYYLANQSRITAQQKRELWGMGVFAVGVIVLVVSVVRLFLPTALLGLLIMVTGMAIAFSKNRKEVKAQAWKMWREAKKLFKL